MSKRYLYCTGILNRCDFFLWSVLDRQQTDLKKRIRKEEILKNKTLKKEEAIQWYILKYQARIRRLYKILKLSYSQLIIKTYEEIAVQDKKIKERITYKNLIKEEKQDVEYVAIIERDMEVFL